MAYMMDLPTFSDQRACLTVIEKKLPFTVKRVYYIYDIKTQRGGHRHKKNRQALVCLGGQCEVYVHDGTSEQIFLLNDPRQCLILDTQDWHAMDKFSQGAILLVLASEYYDVHDYIDERY